MYNQMTEIMSALRQEMFTLNQHLEQDKKTLSERQTEVLDQGNIDKLSSRNAIDGHIHALQNHPQWPSFQKTLENESSRQSPSPYDAAIELWRDIAEEMKKTQHLIAVHQRVIQASLGYYTQLVAALVKAGSEDGSLVYEKKGK